MVQADDVPEAGDGAVTLSLVERLRRRTVERTEPHPNGWGHVKREYPDPLCQQAADEIERLRSQGGAPEPTDDMAEAGRDWAQREWKASGDPKGYLDFYRGIYRAMLSAAPQPPVSQPPGTDRSALASSVMPDKEAAAAAYFRSAIADGEAAVLLNDLATYDNVLRELGIQESHTHPVDEVRRVQSLAETGHTRGVESAAKLIDRKVQDYTSEHGSLDPETGAMEFSRSGEEYVSTLEELAEEIRSSLAPGPAQPPEGGTGWRDISSAPLDQPVLLARYNARVFIGCWGDYQKYNSPSITHWMPLPSPPGQDDRTDVQADVPPAASGGAVNVSVSPIDALEAARAAHMARLPGEPAFKLDPAEISTAEIDGQSWLFLRADKLIELARDFIAAKHRIGDRTNDGSDEDGSLNHG